nr:unnamed protein product [Callosobruchus analis]
MDLWKNHCINNTQTNDSSFHSLYVYCNEDFYPYTKKILKIVLYLPVTVASAERSFSALKRLKSWLRSNMTLERLCGLALMHVNKDTHIDIDNVVNRFANAKNGLLTLLYRFKY